MNVYFTSMSIEETSMAYCLLCLQMIPGAPVDVGCLALLLGAPQESPLLGAQP